MTLRSYDEWLMRCREAKGKINTPEDVYAQALTLITDYQKEHFVTLYLDTKNKILHKEVVSIGSLNANIVQPRDVFRPAVQRGATHIVVAHNHPSGDPSPSQEDIEITKKLVEGGKILGIDVLDHVVIGDSRHFSMKEKGYL